MFGARMSTDDIHVSRNAESFTKPQEMNTFFKKTTPANENPFKTRALIKLWSSIAYVVANWSGSILSISALYICWDIYSWLYPS